MGLFCGAPPPPESAPFTPLAALPSGPPPPPSKTGQLHKRTKTRADGSSYTLWAVQVTIGYRQDGSRLRKTVYGKTQREVLEKKIALEGQIATGSFSDTRITLSQYLKGWLDYKKLERKPRSYHYYADYLRLYVKPNIGRIELAKLTPMHIQSMMKAVARSVSADAANKARGVLTTALKQAVQLGLIPRNPVEAVSKLRYGTKEVSLWTPDQVLHFLKVAEPNPFFAAFYLAMSTGMRHGEILGLRWQDIEDDIITVRQAVVNVTGAQYEVSTPKTKKGIRRIAIDADTIEVLRQHREHQDRQRAYCRKSWVETGYVFTNEFRDLLVPCNFDKVWYDLLEESDLPPIRFHDMRHLHVSLLVKRGFDPRTIADRVGHTDPAFTLRQYSHMFEAQRRIAAVSLKDMLSDDTADEDGDTAPEEPSSGE